MVIESFFLSATNWFVHLGEGKSFAKILARALDFTVGGTDSRTIISLGDRKGGCGSVEKSKT